MEVTKDGYAVVGMMRATRSKGKVEAEYLKVYNAGNLVLACTRSKVGKPGDMKEHVNEEYLIDEFSDSTKTQLAFVDLENLDAGGKSSPKMGAFSIYDTNGNRRITDEGRRILQYELPIICVLEAEGTGGTTKYEIPETDKMTGMMKYMLSKILMNLRNEQEETDDEVRLYLSALPEAYTLWWYLGFRHPSVGPFITDPGEIEEKAGDDGIPMYLWIKDTGGEKDDWRSMPNFNDAWINDTTNEKNYDKANAGGRKYAQSNPRGFYELAETYSNSFSIFNPFTLKDDFKATLVSQNKRQRTKFPVSLHLF